MCTTHLNLRNGHKIPIIGLGLASKTPAESLILEDCIEHALEVGYRHFDTAYLYKTEKALGAVLTKWFTLGKLRREDVFITTKLPSIGMHPAKIAHFLQLSLKNLQLDYVDLYLVHWPIGLTYINDDELVSKDQEDGKILYDMSTNLEAIWSEMEEQVELGYAKSIGVCNFNAGQIERICKSVKLLPAVLQIELNIYIQQNKLRDLCSQHAIQVIAYAPLGSPGRNAKTPNNNVFFPNLMNDEIVAGLAKAHNNSPAQILLRFLTQQNVCIIPKSTNLARIRENVKSLEFDLAPEDIKKLKLLDRGEEAGRCFDFFPGGKSHPEYPFN